MTGVIINPGSGPLAEAGEGWTNTEATARATAEQWLANMHAEGLRDVELLPGSEESDGRWRFTFRHTVTGVTADLETHGIDDMDAYTRRRLFVPRTYWNGSSCSDPDLSDFVAEGFEPVKTYRPVEGRDSEGTAA